MKTVKSSDGFLGLPKQIESKNKVLVIPFGLENTVSYGSGTKMGPKKIIKASHQVELFDDELKKESYKKFNLKTLKEASSWGKVDTAEEQMVFAEATSVMPLIASDAYHRGCWKKRPNRNFSQIFKK